MNVSANAGEGKGCRVRLRAEFILFLFAGALLGIWHAQMGTKAVFTFGKDEPYTSWVGIFSGPLSTLPAVAIALYSRRWSAGWLIAGGIVSLVALSVRATAKGNPLGEFAELLTSFLLMVTGPMIALGLGLLWIDRRLENHPWSRIASGKTGHLNLLVVGLISYFLLSLGAFVVADFRLFNTAIEPILGLWLTTLLLGPLMMLALGRFIGMPVYLAESVVVLGLLWLAITDQGRRRAALLGALAAWLVSGLLFLAIVFAWS